MFSLPSTTLRYGSAAWLIVGLTACADLALPSASFAGQPTVSPCQISAPAFPVTAARIDAGTPSTSLLLAQALPNQPVGAELGEPACTYDPPLPPKPPIIRGLW